MSKQRHQIIEAQTLMRNPAEPDAPSRLVQKHVFLRLCIKKRHPVWGFCQKLSFCMSFYRSLFKKQMFSHRGNPAEPSAPSRLVQKHMFLRLCIKNMLFRMRLFAKVVIWYTFLMSLFKKQLFSCRGNPTEPVTQPRPHEQYFIICKSEP